MANPVIDALQPICLIASAAIPSDVIASAESAGDRGTPTTAGITGVTTTDGGLVGVMPFVTTTIVEYATDKFGHTLTVAVPEIYNSATTILGTPVVFSSTRTTSTLTPARPTPFPLGTSSAPAAVSSLSTSAVISTTIVSASSSSIPTSIAASVSSASAGSIASRISTDSMSAIIGSSTRSASGPTGDNGSPFSTQSSATKPIARVSTVIIAFLMLLLSVFCLISGD
ncbi:Cell wall integrity and stress response component 4 [Varicellaria rhodocarpa]|nr:Cell wall integrity and stress response component 4 [Varicellaria rhodocarpa]